MLIWRGKSSKKERTKKVQKTYFETNGLIYLAYTPFFIHLLSYPALFLVRVAGRWGKGGGHGVRNVHFRQWPFRRREDIGSGSGEGSQGQPRSGCRGKKLGLEISHFKSEQGEQEEKWAPLFSGRGRRPFSGLSRLSTASLALASMDMTAVVWRPKEDIEVLDTAYWVSKPGNGL